MRHISKETIAIAILVLIASGIAIYEYKKRNTPETPVSGYNINNWIKSPSYLVTPDIGGKTVMYFHSSSTMK